MAPSTNIFFGTHLHTGDSSVAALIDKFFDLLSQHGSYRIVKWLADSGCMVSVGKSADLHGYLRDMVQSNLILSGFSANSQETADKMGQIMMYVLSCDTDTPGVKFELQNVHTTDSARMNLLSFTHPVEDLGYDVALSVRNFSGFHKLDPSTGKVHRIPFRHDPHNHCWWMYTALALDQAAAEQAGIIIEQVFPRLTEDIIKQALHYSAHCTRVMQCIGGT